jgi:FkbM family methyltransferase
VTYQPRLITDPQEIDSLSPWLGIKDDRSWTAIIPDWNDYARDEVMRLCHPDRRKVVVEAGGHHGLYARLFAQMFEVVYAFEPHPLNFHCLVNNCQVDNVIKIQAALGRESGRVCSYFNPDNTGASSVDATVAGAAIPMLPLDVFDLPALDLLWLDVEGFETACLFGADKHIKQFKPVIVVERANQSAYDFLSQNGYVCDCVHNIDHFFVQSS